MNVLIDICHPGQVHLLKNVFRNLKKDGHNVVVTTKDVPIIKTLLDEEEIPFIILGEKYDSIGMKAVDQIKYDIEALQICNKNAIDVGVGSSVTIAHTSRLCQMASILLDDDDDEVEPLFVKYGHAFANTVLSPSAVKEHRKCKQAVFYDGYHQLAYLSPTRFHPDPSILSEVGLLEGKKYFIMRFNSFKAHHDVGNYGLSLEQKLILVNLLNQYGKVFITTEREVEPELIQYQLPVSPNKAHSLLNYATMFLGDSQTMTSEAAVLGVPSMRCNTFVGRLSVIEEEEHKYGLTYGFLPQDFDKMVLKTKELLEQPNLKDIWAEKRKRMLADKIDVTAFFTWFIENYPESKKIMKENPDYQYRFK